MSRITGANPLELGIAFVGLFVVMFVIALLFAVPTIWALNLIFGLSIGYSIKTCFAIAWLSTVVKSSTTSSK